MQREREKIQITATFCLIHLLFSFHFISSLFSFLWLFICCVSFHFTIEVDVVGGLSLYFFLSFSLMCSIFQQQLLLPCFCYWVHLLNWSFNLECVSASERVHTIVFNKKHNAHTQMIWFNKITWTTLCCRFCAFLVFLLLLISFRFAIYWFSLKQTLQYALLFHFYFSLLWIRCMKCTFMSSALTFAGLRFILMDFIYLFYLAHVVCVHVHQIIAAKMQQN